MKVRRIACCHRIHLTKKKKPRESFLLNQGADYCCSVLKHLLLTATIYPAVNNRAKQTISLDKKVYKVT